MKYLELVSGSGERIRCLVASTFWSRFVGLMGRALPPPPGTGLLIRPCNSIHMFFMRFPIDVAFLARDFTILKVFRNLAPWKLVGAVKGACQVVEVGAGNLPSSFKEGSRLQVKFLESL